MTTYIPKETALRVVEKYGTTSDFALGRHAGLAICIASEIAEIPAADVAPVAHGRWVHEHISEGYAWVMCSECEAVIHKILINKRLNYCPNCGAKMDGGDSDEAD